MNILIVDDHPLFRDGLTYILSDIGEKINIFEADNFELALERVSSNPDIDLVLLDLYLPGKNGFELLEYLREAYPDIPVVILSASDEAADIQRSINSGARGFIPKQTSSAIISSAIKLILSGGIYIPQTKQSGEKQGSHSDIHHLTPRQVEVLSLLTDGHSNKLIAQHLDLSESTVKVHITSIFKTLGVTSRIQAVIAAKRDGII